MTLGTQKPSRILIVKLSSLGDVVHAMAAVQDIRRALPAAQIDWVVERAFAPLVQRCEGVRRAIPVELRRWRKSPFAVDTRNAWRAFKTELQSERYDAVIDLQGLTKSALICWLAKLEKLGGGGKRYAMANRTDGSSYEAPTRWVADRAIALEPHVHAVERSRLLCAAALGYTLSGPAQFGLKASASAAPTVKPVVALVHGTSRKDKEWPLAHWIELGQRLNQSGYQVAIAHGSASEQVTSEQIATGLQDAYVWPSMSLDALVDHMAQCQGVIGVDSGLSHIAVALDLPHVQIYNFDTAWRTGVDNSRQVSIYAKPTPTVDAVWQAWQACQQAAVPA